MGCWFITKYVHWCNNIIWVWSPRVESTREKIKINEKGMMLRWIEVEGFIAWGNISAILFVSLSLSLSLSLYPSLSLSLSLSISLSLSLSLSLSVYIYIYIVNALIEVALRFIEYIIAFSSSCGCIFFSLILYQEHIVCIFEWCHLVYILI